MKKLIFILLCIFGLCINTNAQNYIYSNHWCETYAISMTYDHFNENHGGKTTDFKNNQLGFSMVIYGAYMDATFGIKNYSVYDDCDMTTWGINFGYLVPLNRRRYDGLRFYVGPAIGFQRVGQWHSETVWDYDFDYYGYYDYPRERLCFDSADKYINYGALIGVSYKHLFLTGKLTRMQCGLQIGCTF